MEQSDEDLNDLLEDAFEDLADEIQQPSSSANDSPDLVSNEQQKPQQKQQFSILQDQSPQTGFLSPQHARAYDPNYLDNQKAASIAPNLTQNTSIPPDTKQQSHGIVFDSQSFQQNVQTSSSSTAASSPQPATETQPQPLQGTTCASTSSPPAPHPPVFDPLQRRRKKQGKDVAGSSSTPGAAVQRNGSTSQAKQSNPAVSADNLGAPDQGHVGVGVKQSGTAVGASSNSGSRSKGKQSMSSFDFGASLRGTSQSSHRTPKPKQTITNPQQQNASQANATTLQAMKDALPTSLPTPPPPPTSQPATNDQESIEKVLQAMMGGLMGEGGAGLGDATSADSSSFMDQLAEHVLSALLDKDTLYPALKDIRDKYPSWLAENKEDLPQAEYDNYSKQYDIVSTMCTTYETTPDDSQKITKLLHEMQACGDPPKAVAGAGESGDGGITNFLKQIQLG